MVKSLDDDQLELLEAIMGKDIDEAAEFDMISSELKAMGMDEEDIEDLQQLSELMHLFLKQIPAVSTKLELTQEHDLLDNVQVLFSVDIVQNVLNPNFSFISSDFLTSLGLLVTLPSTTFLRKWTKLMARSWILKLNQL